MFKLHYYVEDNGDGSSSAVFCESAKQADKESSKANYGDSCAEHLILRYNSENGKIEYRRTSAHFEGKGKNKKIVQDITWIPLEEV